MRVVGSYEYAVSGNCAGHADGYQSRYYGSLLDDARNAPAPVVCRMATVAVSGHPARRAHLLARTKPSDRLHEQVQVRSPRALTQCAPRALTALTQCGPRRRRPASPQVRAHQPKAFFDPSLHHTAT